MTSGTAEMDAWLAGQRNAFEALAGRTVSAWSGVLAAADLRRVGLPDPLPTRAIAAAAPGYLDPSQVRWYTSSNWPMDALEHLVSEAFEQHTGERDLHHRGVPALRPGPNEGQVELHDYLVQHHLQVRRHHPTSEQLWRTITDVGNISLIADHARTLGPNAHVRGLRREAAAIWRIAAHDGDSYAAARLARLLADRDDAEALAELRSLADGGAWPAPDLFLELLVRLGSQRDAGALEELRVRADSGDFRAESSLAHLLGMLGDADAMVELRMRAAAGDRPAARQLAMLLAERGDEESLTELRTMAEVDGFNSFYAKFSFVDLLGQRRDPEALAELKSWASAGDTHAGRRLREVLAEQGDGKALDELLARSRAGDTESDEFLARLLAERGDAQAMAELRRRSNAGDMTFQGPLADLLAAQGDSEAIAELKERAEVDVCAARLYADLLSTRRVPGALIELEVAAEEGDGFAQSSLVEMLVQCGDAASLVQLKRCVHAKYRHAADGLIALYRSRGNACFDLDANANPRSFPNA